ncbi:MAG: MarR family transcriptional regulator [Parachlamydiales bacterium]|nr:MarR family transcriptional regulator [Verrucomicrobiota bacterium]MBX3719013.1 MarR family transcriptional regulator [Candidatus Acheromyda pituitae]
MRKVNFETISSHRSAEESPGFLLWRASTLWRRAIEDVLKPLGLTHPQFVVLATVGWLTRTGNKVTQVEIGKQAALDPNTTSQILKGLEAKGLVERLRLTDERSKHSTLTRTGVDKLKQALPAVEKADAAFFSEVSPLKPEMLKVLQNLAMCAQ